MTEISFSGLQFSFDLDLCDSKAIQTSDLFVSFDATSLVFSLI